MYSLIMSYPRTKIWLHQEIKSSWLALYPYGSFYSSSIAMNNSQWNHEIDLITSSCSMFMTNIVNSTIVKVVGKKKKIWGHSQT